MRRLITFAFGLYLALLAGTLAAQQSFSTLVANESLFTEGERKTLQRDADLAQRSGVPIMFVVVQGDSTSAGSAQQFAIQHRSEHEVETSPGADDGIVFLIHWVPNNPTQSSVVYSAGEHAFDTTGLSDVAIQQYINEFVQPRLESGQLFGATAFLIRFTRYTSLYAPPPVQEITGLANAVQKVLTVAAPLLLIGSAFAMWRDRTPDPRRRWRVVTYVLAGSAFLFALSVWTHNRVGIVSIIGLLISLTIWCLWVTYDHEREPGRWQRRLPDIVIAATVIGLSFAINLEQVAITTVDRDETRWMSRAHYAESLTDPFGPTWQDYAVTVGQPPLGSIAIGIGMALQNQSLPAAGVWDYQYDENWYRATGGYPTEEALHTARRTNVVIGAIATGAAFVLGRLLTNRIGGITAAAYLAWHPLHIVLSSQALSDETFALMLLLALIAAWQFAEKPTWGRAVLLGILLGLGGATKLTPLLLAPPLAVYGLIRLKFDLTPVGKRAGWMLIAQPFIAFAAFTAIYPWTWVNPLERTWRLFSFRAGEMEAQSTAWPGSLTEGPFDALARFGQKLTYTHSTSQKAIQHLYDWFGIDRVAVGIDLLFAAAGGVILLWIVASKGLWTPYALVACLLLGELMILAIGMNADFYRYHLPVVMIASACIAVSTGHIWNLAIVLIRRRRIVSEPTMSAEVAT